MAHFHFKGNVNLFDVKSIYEKFRGMHGINVRNHGGETHYVTEYDCNTKVIYVETKFPSKKSSAISVVAFSVRKNKDNEVVMCGLAGEFSPDIVICYSHGLIILACMHYGSFNNLHDRYKKLNPVLTTDSIILRETIIYESKLFNNYTDSEILPFVNPISWTKYKNLFVNGEKLNKISDIKKLGSKIRIGATEDNLYLEKTFGTGSIVKYYLDNWDLNFAIRVTWKKIYYMSPYDARNKKVGGGIKYLIGKKIDLTTHQPDIVIFFPGNRIYVYTLVCSNKHSKREFSPAHEVGEVEVVEWLNRKYRLRN
jgi:hypothetical protein